VSIPFSSSIQINEFGEEMTHIATIDATKSASIDTNIAKIQDELKLKKLQSQNQSLI
jgi:hypothetical protein